MLMEKNVADVYSVIMQDMKIRRLLVYENDPLNESLSDINDYNKIAEKVIFTPTFDGLDVDKTNRICVYLGIRDMDRHKHKLSNQELYVDVLSHRNYHDRDARAYMICDRINQIISESRITGIGKIYFSRGFPISAPTGYIGYRLVYDMGSSNV